MTMYDIIVETLEEGQAGTLATIVEKKGAAPREQGANMFIRQDGKFFGTVGGGCVEAEVWQHAMRVFKGKVPRMIRYTMDGREVEDAGMICGGNVDIFLEPVLERHKDLYTAIASHGKRGKRGLIVTRFGSDSYFKAFMDGEGNTWGDEPDEATKLLFEESVFEKKTRVLDDGTIVEPVTSGSNLYIFGAGHVSQYLSKVAKMVEFNVFVIDDRAEFANSERFPEADGILAEEFQTAFDKLDFAGNAYVVIVTRGHKHDAFVLEEALKRKTAYVGMIGSKRKVKMVLDFLKTKGFSDEVLGRVYAPIGIDINSETPQEIAVSIAGELIRVRGER